MVNHLSQVPIGPTFNSPFGQGKGFADLVSIILSTAITISGVLLLFLLIFGGISIIIGAGKGDPEATARGKAAATAAVIGFGVIFVSYWIIQIVEYVTGYAILNPAIL